MISTILTRSVTEKTGLVDVRMQGPGQLGEPRDVRSLQRRRVPRSQGKRGTDGKTGHVFSLCPYDVETKAKRDGETQLVTGSAKIRLISAAASPRLTVCSHVPGV